MLRPFYSEIARFWIDASLTEAFNDENDFLTAFHIIMPAMEWIVHLLAQKYVDSAHRSSDLVPGISQNVESLRQNDSFLYRHLHILISDRHGCNLRNRYAHGLSTNDG